MEYLKQSEMFGTEYDLSGNSNLSLQAGFFILLDVYFMLQLDEATHSTGNSDVTFVSSVGGNRNIPLLKALITIALPS